MILTSKLLKTDKYMERDYKGDAITPSIPDDFDDIYNPTTYSSHFEHGDGSFYDYDYEKVLKYYEEPRKDLPKFDLVYHKLFDIELPATEEYLAKKEYIIII